MFRCDLLDVSVIPKELLAITYPTKPCVVLGAGREVFAEIFRFTVPLIAWGTEIITAVEDGEGVYCFDRLRRIDEPRFQAEFFIKQIK